MPSSDAKTLDPSPRTVERSTIESRALKSHCLLHQSRQHVLPARRPRRSSSPRAICCGPFSWAFLFMA